MKKNTAIILIAMVVISIFITIPNFYLVLFENQKFNTSEFLIFSIRTTLTLILLVSLFILINAIISKEKKPIKKSFGIKLFVSVPTIIFVVTLLSNLPEILGDKNYIKISQIFTATFISLLLLGPVGVIINNHNK